MTIVVQDFSIPARHARSNVLVVGEKALLLRYTKPSTPESNWLLGILEGSSGQGPAEEEGSHRRKKSRTESVDFRRVDTHLLHQVSELLTPTNEVGSSLETFLPYSEHGARRIVLCALPTGHSRYNCPARPHAITDFIKSRKGKGSLVIVILLSNSRLAFASGAAVARAFPLYSRKGGSKRGMPAPTISQEKDREDGAQPDPVYLLFNEVEDEDVIRIRETAKNIQLCCRLVDAPCNELHTDSMVAEAKSAAASLGNVKVTVIRGEELKVRGFGGIYGVGKASSHPPALVVLSFFPEGTEEGTAKGLAMVGKGIVYDTGGLSIKTKDGMPGMKRDMGGAAAVLGAFCAAVKSNAFSLPLHAVLCLAENSVSANSTRPDDIHTLYSGKTVEVNNTDAEGRLVLSDGVVYAAKHLNPSVIVDIATLTGAQAIATGNKIACILTNSEEMEKVVVKAGKASGDLCHPVPYCPEFFAPEFASAVADMKNSVKNRANGQVSCAGQFIANHLGDWLGKGMWAHIDFAAPSYTAGDERATGFGVALFQVFRNIFKLDKDPPQAVAAADKGLQPKRQELFHTSFTPLVSSPNNGQSSSSNGIVASLYSRDFRGPSPPPFSDVTKTHVCLLLSSFKRWTGRDLLSAVQEKQKATDQHSGEKGRVEHKDIENVELFKKIYEADFILVSHGIQTDPVLNYGNLQAQRLWETDWRSLTSMPSRYTAEESRRTARSEHLAQVAKDGYMSGYSGVRVSTKKNRFEILDAFLWDVVVDEREFRCQFQDGEETSGEEERTLREIGTRADLPVVLLGTKRELVRRPDGLIKVGQAAAIRRWNVLGNSAGKY